MITPHLQHQQKRTANARFLMPQQAEKQLSKKALEKSLFPVEMEGCLQFPVKRLNEEKR